MRDSFVATLIVTGAVLPFLLLAIGFCWVTGIIPAAYVTYYNAHSKEELVDQVYCGKVTVEQIHKPTKWVEYISGFAQIRSDGLNYKTRITNALGQSVTFVLRPASPEVPGPYLTWSSEWNIHPKVLRTVLTPNELDHSFAITNTQSLPVLYGLENPDTRRGSAPMPTAAGFVGVSPAFLSPDDFTSLSTCRDFKWLAVEDAPGHTSEEARDGFGLYFYLIEE
jgi:hypothetical protein